MVLLFGVACRFLSFWCFWFCAVFGRFVWFALLSAMLLVLWFSGSFGLVVLCGGCVICDFVSGLFCVLGYGCTTWWCLWFDAL